MIAYLYLQGCFLDSDEPQLRTTQVTFLRRPNKTILLRLIFFNTQHLDDI